MKSEERDAGFLPFVTKFQGVDFVAFAAACGAAGFRCDTPAQVADMITAAFAHNGPSIVEAVVRNSEERHGAAGVRGQVWLVLVRPDRYVADVLSTDVSDELTAVLQTHFVSSVPAS